MLAIKNNLMAESAARYLGKSYEALAQSVERLSSGLRINSAKDDAAGLAVRELIRADVAVLRQGSRNALDGVSMLQAAEGAMASIDEILVRMNELCEQAATGSYSSTQKDIMQAEFQELSQEITRIAENAEFNGNFLLKQDGTTVEIHVASGTDTITLTSQAMTAAGLGIGGKIESFSANYWVTDSDTAKYLSNADLANASTLTFTFGTQDPIAITLAVDTEYTLDEIVTLVNNASLLTSESYSAAEAYQDDTTGQYTLRVSAATGGAIASTAAEGGSGDLVWGVKTSGDDFADADMIESAGTGTVLNIKTDNVTAATALESAIEEKDNFRAELGYKMNRLEAAVAVLNIQAESLLAAESRISDVDVATEMAKMTRNQVLAQAGISMLAQANMMPQMALQLLT